MKTACSKAKVKANATVLEALRRAVAEKKSQKDGEVEVYTAKTFTAYETVLNKIVAALEDTDNLSQDTAEKLKTQIEEKEAALEYSKVERELAELELQAGVEYNADDYTTASAKAYTVSCVAYSFVFSSSATAFALSTAALESVVQFAASLLPVAAIASSSFVLSTVAAALLLVLIIEISGIFSPQVTVTSKILLSEATANSLIAWLSLPSVTLWILLPSSFAILAVTTASDAAPFWIIRIVLFASRSEMR